jgi:peptidoglycan/LPS O-acetylase OafA/YrhL
MQPSAPATSHIRYRPEIDGLRAIAVTAVVVLHAGFTTFGGGFTGVDIFFVISGYLITLGLLNNLQERRFSIVAFYERRARRILPALLFVLLACTCYAIIRLSPHDIPRFVRSLLAVLAFGSNIYFSYNTGYFDPGASETPLLHTWSLGVEEQFYILFPIVLWLTWVATRRSIPILLAAILIGSFIWSDAAAHNEPAHAFYWLQSRAWELCLGSIIAWVEWKKLPAPPRALREVAALAGLIAIGYAIMAYTEVTPFPGRYALAPVLGAGAIIAFATRETAVARCLSNRVFVAIGLISYSLYLWHQPIIVFARMTQIDPIPNVGSALLVAISFVFAWLTWKYVERPFRGSAIVPRRRLIPIFAGATACVLALCAFATFAPPRADRRGFPSEVWASLDWPGNRDCLDVPNAARRKDRWYCEVNVNAEPQPSFIVYGDSHSYALLPAFAHAAVRDSARGIFISMSGCAPLFDVVVLDDVTGNCTRFADRVRDIIRQKRIRRIYLVGRWTHYTGEEDGSGGRYLGDATRSDRTIASTRAVFEDGLRRTLDEFVRDSATVTIFDQVPYQPHSPDAVYRAIELKRNRTSLLREYSVTESHHDSTQAFANSLLARYAAPRGMRVINRDRALCDGAVCLIGDEQHSFYIDNHHLSVAGAKRAESLVLSLISLR